MNKDRGEPMVGIDPALSGSETVVTAWDIGEEQHDGGRTIRLADVIPLSDPDNSTLWDMLGRYQPDLFCTRMPEEFIMGDGSPNQRHSAEADQIRKWLTVDVKLV